MSDFRRFCIAYFVVTTVMTAIEWAGMPVKQSGMDLVLAKFLIGFSFGAAIVAIWGRRTA